jgi:serine phosphatase RsbU (regulator of sigma subunit)
VNLGPFQFGAASLPFLVSAAVVITMALYVALIRGAPLLRGAFLAITVCVLPLVVNSALGSATDSRELAIKLYRVGYAPLPLAGTGVMCFLLAVVGRVRERLALIVGCAVIATAIGVLALATPWVIADVFRVPTGVLYQKGTPLAVTGIGFIGLQVGLGSLYALRAIKDEPSPKRRRQVKGAIAAFSISALGGTDAFLSFGIGWYPTAWFFLTIGPLLALRSLVADDLIRARAIDRRMLLAVPYASAAAFGTWLVARQREAPAGLLLAELLVLFFVLRLVVGLTRRWLAGAEVSVDSPLERAFERFATRAQALATEAELASAGEDVLRLALGCEKFALVLPRDGRWITADGHPAPITPDTAALARRIEKDAPIVERDALALERGDRAALTAVVEAFGAEAITVLAAGEELLGLLAIGHLPGERALKPDELHLVRRVADQLRDGLAYATISRQAKVRAAVKAEVSLAATVQEAFMPGREIMTLPGVELCGAYEPATQCGGDWWSAHSLTDGRTLVLIGDVTGHGLPAALVTAAARGCVDVVLRLAGPRLDLIELLEALDEVVRHHGGGQFHMTCFATLLDPRRGEVTYASAGHVVPYVVKGAELDVLASRGNPLGSGAALDVTAQRRALGRDDRLVWYTDGLVECLGPDSRPYGDRRLQRALRKLAGAGPAAIRDGLLAENTAFRGGISAADDVTLVVARIGT